MAEALPMKSPSLAAVRARLRQLERLPAPGTGTLGDCLADLYERLALRKLLRGQRDALEVAEQLSPGVIARIEMFAMEGGR